MKTFKLPISMPSSDVVLIILTPNAIKEGLYEDGTYLLFLKPYSEKDKIATNIDNSKALARLFATAGVFRTEYRYVLPFLVEGNYMGYSGEEMAKLLIETEFICDMLAKEDNVPHYGIPHNILLEENFARLFERMHPKKPTIQDWFEFVENNIPNN